MSSGEEMKWEPGRSRRAMNFKEKREMPMTHCHLLEGRGAPWRDARAKPRLGTWTSIHFYREGGPDSWCNGGC